MRRVVQSHAVTAARTANFDYSSNALPQARHAVAHAHAVAFGQPGELSSLRRRLWRLRLLSVWVWAFIPDGGYDEWQARNT